MNFMILYTLYNDNEVFVCLFMLQIVTKRRQIKIEIKLDRWDHLHQSCVHLYETAKGKEEEKEVKKMKKVYNLFGRFSCVNAHRHPNNVFFTFHP